MGDSNIVRELAATQNLLFAPGGSTAQESLVSVCQTAEDDLVIMLFCLLLRHISLIDFALVGVMVVLDRRTFLDGDTNTVVVPADNACHLR